MWRIRVWLRPAPGTFPSWRPGLSLTLEKVPRGLSLENWVDESPPREKLRSPRPGSAVHPSAPADRRWKSVVRKTKPKKKKKEEEENVLTVSYTEASLSPLPLPPPPLPLPLPLSLCMCVCLRMCTCMHASFINCRLGHRQQKSLGTGYGQPGEPHD